MTWVKVCGITNVQDALTAVEAGADALGFVFYEKSPRHVAQEAVRDIVRQLPATTKIEKVGVFVGESLDEMERIAEAAGLTGIQLHVRFPHSQWGRRATLGSKTTKYMVLRANDLLDGRFTSLAWYQDVKDSI